MFELFYHVENCGDGSVSVRFHPNKDSAEHADTDMSEGWGESSANSIKLKVEKGKLFYQEFRRINGTYTHVWTPVD